jgi:hypothetical protein
MTNALLRVNAPQVISETIDGETIAIDLTTGTYYSLGGSGVEVWQLLEAGRPLDAVVDEVAACYGRRAEELRGDLVGFVEELRREGLVADADESGPRSLLPSADRPYAPPRFERYTDMSDLVQLDPVHAVGEQGWPHPAPSA